MAVYREVIESPPDQSFRLLQWENSLSEVQVSIGPGRWSAIEGRGERWHAHRAVELTYIHRGSGTRFIGDHIGAIGPPELVLIGADLPHYWRGLDESRGAALQFDLSNSGGLGSLREAARLANLRANASRGLLFDESLTAEVGERMLTLSRYGPVERLASVLAILARLEEACEQAAPLCEKEYTITASAAHADKIRDAIDLLLEHHAEELTVDDVAQAVGLSRATLCRYFRRYTGRSVVAFLNEARIDQAKRALHETATPISQIALAVGFGNLSNFNRQFRRAVGRSPREYRRASAAQ